MTSYKLNDNKRYPVVCFIWLSPVLPVTFGSEITLLDNLYPQENVQTYITGNNYGSTLTLKYIC